jgi:GNAT superfamily N-acetyltransferase
VLTLTAKGRRAFLELDSKSNERAKEILDTLVPAERRQLLSAITGVERLLSQKKESAPRTVVIREPKPGDIGWAIAAHGELYAKQFGWNAEFEALVAKLFADFANGRDADAERMWVAELDGERVGTVFVVRNADDATVAQLRCLLVDPKARGLGVGTRLVNESRPRRPGLAPRSVRHYRSRQAAKVTGAGRGYMIRSSTHRRDKTPGSASYTNSWSSARSDLDCFREEEL